MRTRMVAITLFFIAGMVITGDDTFTSSVQAKSLYPVNGHFNAYIVVPARATEIERYAADELALYIARITGAEIGVITEKPNLAYFGFYIGSTSAGSTYAPPRISPHMGANGFRIASIPNGLVIIGGDDLSTLFGVYAFLEEHQGCGWFMPYELGQVVPKRDFIHIPESIDETQVPDIPIRWIGTDDWALKNRMNTSVSIHGHEVGVINKWIFHTYAPLVPNDQYFDEHPEYYSLVEARRVRQDREGRGQICTSNPELIKTVAQRLIDNLRRNPDITFISLTANDWGGFCECGGCNALSEPERKDDQFGKVSGVVHTFNNAVAPRVKKYCPDQLIKVGAYWQYTRYPLDPAYRPAENLSVQVTPNIEFCHNHAVNDPQCPYNVDFMKEFNKWVAHAKHLQIYGYNSLHGWSQLPWPMVHCLREDIPYYHSIGVELFFTQYWYQSLSYALNYHIAAKLAWDTSLDVDKAMTDLCVKMYGAAAPAMERYHRYLEESWKNNPHHVGYFVEPVSLSMPKFYPPEMMAEANRLLSDAESVEADKLSRERVRQIRIDFNYLRLWLNYLDAISAPFAGINPEQNPIGWDEACKQAASIGEILSNNIISYMDEHYPEHLRTYWGGIPQRMLQAHRYPERIPGAQRTKEQ